MKKYRIDEITINLDNKRKPLNNKERKAISKFKLYPYYGANNIVDYVDEYIFDEEILCVAEDGGSWGYNEECAYIVNQKCWVNNHAHVLKAKNNLNIRYLSYYLNFKNLSNVITGTTRGKLTKSALNSIEILLPELNKQDKIVEILEKSKELMDKRKEQIEALDELVKSKFVDMFGNLYTNDMEWEASIISDYCKVKGGKRVPKGEKLLDEPTNYPYLRVLDLKNSTVIEDDIKYLSEDIYEKIKRYTITSNDVYLTNVGEKLGMAGTIPERFNNANLTENAVKLVFDNNKINKVYLAYYLNSEVGQKYILERKMIVGVPKLAIFRIETLPLILPPLELQNEFADFVKQVDKLKFEMEKSLKELEDSFNSLMQRAFNGELF